MHYLKSLRSGPGQDAGHRRLPGHRPVLQNPNEQVTVGGYVKVVEPGRTLWPREELSAGPVGANVYQRPTARHDPASFMRHQPAHSTPVEQHGNDGSVSHPSDAAGKVGEPHFAVYPAWPLGDARCRSQQVEVNGHRAGLPERQCRVGSLPEVARECLRGVMHLGLASLIGPDPHRFPGTAVLSLP